MGQRVIFIAIGSTEKIDIEPLVGGVSGDQVLELRERENDRTRDLTRRTAAVLVKGVITPRGRHVPPAYRPSRRRFTPSHCHIFQLPKLCD